MTLKIISGVSVPATRRWLVIAPPRNPVASQPFDDERAIVGGEETMLYGILIRTAVVIIFGSLDSSI